MANALSPVRRGSYTVKGPRHFQFSATRDDVIIECATLLAIMGRYTRRQQRCKESGPRERKGLKLERGTKTSRPHVVKHARVRERERERERGRERERTTMSGGVQVLGNRVSYLVDCVHRFGDAIL